VRFHLLSVVASVYFKTIVVYDWRSVIASSMKRKFLLHSSEYFLWDWQILLPPAARFDLKTFWMHISCNNIMSETPNFYTSLTYDGTLNWRLTFLPLIRTFRSGKASFSSNTSKCIEKLAIHHIILVCMVIGNIAHFNVQTSSALSPSIIKILRMKLLIVELVTGSWGSSVSIVTNYGVDDRAIGVRSLAEAKGFLLQSLSPDQLWGPPSFLSNGYRGSCPPDVKNSRGVRLTTHPHLVQRSRICRSYISSPPIAFKACSGRALAFRN
jgi:hypothetical protein